MWKEARVPREKLNRHRENSKLNTEKPAEKTSDDHTKQNSAKTQTAFGYDAFLLWYNKGRAFTLTTF